MDKALRAFDVHVMLTSEKELITLTDPTYACRPMGTMSTYETMIRYNTIEEFNMDSKAECDQLNLAHETKAWLTHSWQCLARE